MTRYHRCYENGFPFCRGAFERGCPWFSSLKWNGLYICLSSAFVIERPVFSENAPELLMWGKVSAILQEGGGQPTDRPLVLNRCLTTLPEP